MRNPIPCVVHVIELALGVFMSTLSVKGCTESSEAHARDQQFGRNGSRYIGNTRGLQREGNARINNVSAVRPGQAKRFETVRISRHFERHETHLHKAVNACCIDYADTWSSIRVH